jgi:hypothetical protein
MNNSKNNPGRRRELFKRKKQRKSTSANSVLEWIFSPYDAHLAARAFEGKVAQQVELPVIWF